MRSLNLLTGRKRNVSRLQTIWEVWFTLSILATAITGLIWIFNNNAISLTIVSLCALHAVMSTLVGMTTSED